MVSVRIAARDPPAFRAGACRREGGLAQQRQAPHGSFCNGRAKLPVVLRVEGLIGPGLRPHSPKGDAVVALSHSLPPRPLHPLHAILLSFPFPLFLGTLVCDIAYARSYQIQWSNFAQWLNAGGLLVGGFVLLWALVALFLRANRGDRRRAVYFVLVLAMWVLGFINALIHSKDAWAIMPEAPWLSAISALLALLASWVGFSGFRSGRWA